MPKHKTLTATLWTIAFFTLILAFRTSQALCFSQAEAESAIQSAESRLLDCYEAVYGAEEAGANVSSLLMVLNEAGRLLSKAKLAYSNGNFDLAYMYALNCSERLEGIKNQADSLKREAEQARHMDFLINYVGSAAGAVAVMVGGYVAWVFIKRHEKS